MRAAHKKQFYMHTAQVYVKNVATAQRALNPYATYGLFWARKTLHAWNLLYLKTANELSNLYEGK